jgi:hypothetical protein
MRHTLAAGARCRRKNDCHGRAVGKLPLKPFVSTDELISYDLLKGDGNRHDHKARGFLVANLAIIKPGFEAGFCLLSSKPIRNARLNILRRPVPG